MNKEISMYHNIVVPLDGSELAEQVLPYVKDLIRNRAVKVHLISVAPLATVVSTSAAPIRMYPLMMSQAEFALHTHQRERIEQELTGYLHGIAIALPPGPVTADVEVQFGEPAETILAYAEEMNADLIAMCTHGRTGLARWAYGSVAEKVLRHAPCPVLLVRARKKQEN
jgi:nucleotide-binding universal stress UspA family protein